MRSQCGSQVGSGLTGPPRWALLRGSVGLTLSCRLLMAFSRWPQSRGVPVCGHGPLPVWGFREGLVLLMCAVVWKNQKGHRGTQASPFALEETETQSCAGPGRSSPSSLVSGLLTCGSWGHRDHGGCVFIHGFSPVHTCVFTSRSLRPSLAPSACKSGLRLEPSFWKSVQPTQQLPGVVTTVWGLAWPQPEY